MTKASCLSFPGSVFLQGQTVISGNAHFLSFHRTQPICCDIIHVRGQTTDTPSPSPRQNLPRNVAGWDQFWLTCPLVGNGAARTRRRRVPSPGTSKEFFENRISQSIASPKQGLAQSYACASPASLPDSRLQTTRMHFTQ
jgi:hypothetical protein